MMDLRQTLSLKQDLRITHQLILQMKLLQVSALDLEQLVREELEENPAMEQSDEQPATSVEVPAVLPEPTSAPAGETTPEGTPTEAEANGIIDIKPGEEYSPAELLPDDSYSVSTRYSGSDDSGISGVELAAGPDQSVREMMMPKLRSTLSEEDAQIAEYIIDSLDEDGFLTMSVEELAQSKGVTVEHVESILYVIQRLDPGGIACPGRRESFLVQLELAGYEPGSLECKLLASHWDLLMKKQTSKVAKLCGVSEDGVRAAIERILRLEPRPARQFSGSLPAYVAPDFSVEWRDEKLVAVPNDETFPRLRLSQRYIEIIRNPKGVSREQLEFARQKYQRALLFLRGIESRRRTLQHLVELVIEEQHEFFVHGRQCLKPDTLRRAADRLNVHPSTVSRAIAGKYVETTYGIFPLGYFFKAGTGDKSRTSIKQKIQTIIEAEDKSAPLSDDEIGAKLKTEGIEISRRTVAKYRAELGIPGHSERKGF